MDITGGDGVTADRRKSCDLCCSRKRRCDGDGINPCTLCTTKGVPCMYSKKGRRGPKPKPKRDREGEGVFGGEADGLGGMGVGEVGGIPSMLDWAGSQHDGGPPRAKAARMMDVVRLTPSHATGTLGLQENRHLNSFFSGFGACTQIVQEDEIRGAMIHVLSEGQFGMPSVDGESFYSPTSSTSGASSGASAEGGGGASASASTSASSGSGSGDGDSSSGLKLIHLEEGGLGIATGVSEGEEGAGGEKELRQRAQRARLSAGVACLWAGIGVGAMLCGQTAEATSHYAENAREAIKGCYDVVSEEVLRAFLCLAHMHSFREDFPKFFRYTAMANDVAASLDRQGAYAASGKLRKAGYRGPAPKGCSEPAKFLLKCFDAMSHFLELEGEEANSPIEGIIAPQSVHGPSASGSSGVGGGSGSHERLTPPESERSSGTGGNNSGSGGSDPGGDGRGDSPGGSGPAPTTNAEGAGRQTGNGSPPPAAAAAAASASGEASRNNGGSANGGSGLDEDDDWRSVAAARIAAHEEKTARMAVEGQQGPGEAGKEGKEKENEPRMLSPNEVSTLTLKAKVAGALRSNPSALAYEEFPGLKSAVRVQECISVLGDNPVAKRLGNFALSSLNPVFEGQGRSRAERKRLQEESVIDVGEGGGSSIAGGGSESGNRKGGMTFAPLKTNQVLFVGDTRILEVSMGVDCSCISVMCKAVAGAQWSEVQADARIVADTADAILVPVLASPSISRSVCAVKLLANSAFSHLCLGNAEDALRAVRRFSSILREFPGILRFPPWRHCFHWMAGMLESAGLRDLYDGLKKGLDTINMKSMRNLPEFGNGAHDIMCKCSHFRCQATHRALAEHAKQDPYGAFHIPAHCPQFGTAAAATVANGGSRSTAFRAGREASEWAAKLSTVDSRSSGGVGIVDCGNAPRSPREPIPTSAAGIGVGAGDATTTPAAASAAPSAAPPSVAPRPAVPRPPVAKPAAAAAAAGVRAGRGTAVAAAGAAARSVSAQPNGVSMERGIASAAPASRPTVPQLMRTAPAAAAAAAPSMSVPAAAANGRGVQPPPSHCGNGALRTEAFGGVPDTRPRERADVGVAAASAGAANEGPCIDPAQEARWRSMVGTGDKAHPPGAGAHSSSFDFFLGGNLERSVSSLGPGLERQGSFSSEGSSGRAVRAAEDTAVFMSPVVAAGNTNNGDSAGRRHSSFAGNAVAPTAAGINLDSSGRRHSSYDGRNHGTPINTFGRVFEGDGVGSSSNGSPGGSLGGSVVQRHPSFHSGGHNGSSAGGVGELARSVPLPPPTGGVSYSSVPGPGSLQLGATGNVPGVVSGAVPGRNSFGKTGAPPGPTVPAGYFVGNGGASGGGGAGIVSNGRRGSGVVSGGGGVGGGAVSGGVGGAAVSSGFVGGAAVSSGFVGGGRVAAAGAGGMCGGGAGGGGAAGSELAGYTAQEQQLWAALSEGPEVGDGGDVEMGNVGGQEEAELKVFAQEIVGMVFDETKAC